MKTRLINLAAAVALTAGCATTTAVSDFTKDDASGKRKGGTLVFYSGVQPPGKSDLDQLLPASAQGGYNPDFRRVLHDQCGVPKPAGLQPEMAPLLAALLPAVGKLMFDLWINEKARALEALKQASEAAYSGRFAIPDSSLKTGTCLVLVRTLEGESLPAMAAVVKIEDAASDSPGGDVAGPKAFVFRPVYVRVRAAAAVTKKSDTPTITLSIAISLKGLGKQQSGLPTMGLIGESTVTVPGVVIGANAKTVCSDGKCPPSEPIPMPTSPGVVTLALAAAEKGETGIDFDVAANELKALKEAIGPAIAEGLKEQVK